jgi:hypothetical protein
MLRAFLIAGLLTGLPLTQAFGQEVEEKHTSNPAPESAPAPPPAEPVPPDPLEDLVADLHSLDDAGYRPVLIAATGAAALETAVTLQSSNPDLDLRVARTYLFQSTPERVEELIHGEGARCGVWLTGTAESPRARLLGECATDAETATALRIGVFVPEPEAIEASEAELDSDPGEADEGGPLPLVDSLVQEITPTQSQPPIVTIRVGTHATLKLPDADTGAEGYAGRGGPLGLVVFPDGRVVFTPTEEHAGGSWVVEVKRHRESLGSFQVEVPEVETREGAVTAPGLPSTTSETLTPPFQAPYLSEALGRRYRRGHTFVGLGALGILAGTGVAYLGVQLAASLAEDGGVAGLFAVVFIAGPIIVAGVGGAIASVPAMVVGAGTARDALRSAGCKVPGAAMIVSTIFLAAGWACLGAVYFVESVYLLLAGVGAVGLAAVGAVVQVVINEVHRGKHFPRAAVSLVPTSVGRAPGLAFVGRFP